MKEASHWRGFCIFLLSYRCLISAQERDRLEATGGFEPPIGVLQTPALTTWPRRRAEIWSGRRDLNPRPSPWQGDALPLSHSRKTTSPIAKMLSTKSPVEAYHTDGSTVKACAKQTEW